jgi:hypothetical protein
VGRHWQARNDSAQTRNDDDHSNNSYADDNDRTDYVDKRDTHGANHIGSDNLNINGSLVDTECYNKHTNDKLYAADFGRQQTDQHGHEAKRQHDRRQQQCIDNAD